MSRGALRRGEALLAGLLRCGHCGRKLHVAYSGTGGNTGRYHCQGGIINHGGDRCISFGGMRIDRGVGAEVIERLQPLGDRGGARAHGGHAQPARPRTSGGKSSWRWSRPATRRAARDASMMPSIPTIVLSLAELEKTMERAADSRAHIWRKRCEALTTSPATERRLSIVSG